MKSCIDLSFLGGAYEVGASCILLQIHSKNILLDCGIRQSSSKDVLPDFRMIQEKGGIDAIIVSHAHLDHTGALPIISKEFPNVRIYMNNMTKDLIRVLLYDSLKIMNSREAEIPLYAEIDVMNMLDRVYTLNFQVEREILEGIKLTFYPAGHIAGASFIYITTHEGSVFYSGDFSIFPQRTIDGAKIPKLRPDVAIFESTYGDKLHSNREVEENRLIDSVKKCIDNGGKMLIPAFALGRAQEVLLILKRAFNTKKIKGIKVYVDGMVKEINRVYKYNPLYLKSSFGKKILKGIEPFYDENIQPVMSKEDREKILQDKEPCVIVSSSGMLTGGPSQYYAEYIASLDNGYITITGYQDEESLGRQLLQLLESGDEDKTLEINNKIVPLKCKIERIGLSAHGDKGEIKALTNNLKPKNIFLVHGDQSTIESLASEIQEEYFGRIYVPRCGESIEVEIGVPRKQLKKEFEYKMEEHEEITISNIEKLWSFVLKNYGNRLFTMEELLTLWKGSININKDEVQSLQKILTDSPYFENDLRRFFMFKARSQADVEELLKPKELKPNELTELANQYFGEYDFKKASLLFDSKTIVLNFDFPKVVPSSILEVIQKFQCDVNWNVKISRNVNINVADDLIKSFIDPKLIKKISYYTNENRVAVNLYKIDRNYDKEKQAFKSKTGLDLTLFDNRNDVQKANTMNFFKSCKNETMEQNRAFKYIDDSFQSEEFKPYKKSIKGKNYIELFFISPIVGERYTEKIEKLADEIGWDMGISNSVNQNDIISLVKRLCDSRSIFLKKNPSFMLDSLKIIIRPEEIDEIKLQEIKKQFDYYTGCSLEW